MFIVSVRALTQYILVNISRVLAASLSVFVIGLCTNLIMCYHLTIDLKVTLFILQL